MCFPGGSDGKESNCNVRDSGSIPGLGRYPGEGDRLPTPIFWPGEFHRQGIPVSYSPWCYKESDTTERLTHTQTHLRIHSPTRWFLNTYICHRVLGATEGAKMIQIVILPPGAEDLPSRC